MAVSPVVLRNFEIFHSLPDNIILDIGKHSKLAEAPRRKVVMQKNQHVHSLGLLIDGRMQGIDLTLDGREAGLYFVEPNDCFGELSVIDGLPALEYVVALTTSRFVTVPVNLMQQLVQQSPYVANFFNTRLSKRIRESLKQRTLLTMPSPVQRVCTQLIDLTMKDGDEVVIPYAPTHQEIAIMVNTSRETVTRVFQKLQIDGIIVRDGNKLILSDLGLLEAIAKGNKSDS